MKQQKTWADYLWIIELLYLTLGLFNILFAWLGLIFFITPLLISIFRRQQGILQPLLRKRSIIGGC